VSNIILWIRRDQKISSFEPNLLWKRTKILLLSLLLQSKGFASSQSEKEQEAQDLFFSEKTRIRNFVTYVLLEFWNKGDKV
jgi:hypothetical protein